MSPAPRSLWLAAAATLLGAADTYVVVLALPDIATSVGVDITNLQRVAPVVALFLLGYVAALPLSGRISDRSGRIPVLAGSLAIFAIGSMVTAVATDLTTVEVGRFLQGVGGGGLVPVTIALVADLYAPDRRGTPLGAVGAVQEAGAVLGPLFGAGVIALSSWRWIFWINLVLAVGLLLGLTLGPGGRSRRRPGDVIGVGLGLLTLALLGLTLAAPTDLTSDVTLGRAWVPVAGDSRWLTPIALATIVVALAFLARQWWAPSPLVPLRSAGAVTAEVDLLGALLLAVALAGVVFSFSGADPAVQTVAPDAVWLLPVAAVAVVAFAVRQFRSRRPLVPSEAVQARGAWGSLVVSALVGVALIAVLVDVPIYVRVVESGSSQLDAALVLVRFLVAVPIGAVLGGVLTHHVAPRLIAGVGLLLIGGALGLMTRWSATDVTTAGTVLTLLLAGFAFGLVIAPINAITLLATPSAVHGVASALVVGARTIGMTVGVSALTAIGVHRYRVRLRSLRPPTVLCPDDPAHCSLYTDGLRHAAVDQVHIVFAGAAVAALAAGIAAVVLLTGRPTPLTSARR